MSHLWLVSLVLLFWSPATTPVARADLKFAERFLEAGRIRAGQVHEFKFAFTNEGVTPIDLVGVKAGCGCIKASLEPSRVDAGQKGCCLIQLNSLGASQGLNVWQVEINYRRDEQDCKAVLMIRAEAVREIVVQPPELRVHSDGPTTHEFTVSDLRPRGLQIKAVETSAIHLKAALGADAAPLGGRPLRRITLEVGANLPVGQHDGQLAIHTDDPDYPTLFVPIQITRRARQRVTATPASVSLVVSASSLTPSRVVTLRDSQGQSLAIERVEADDPAISCRWSTEPGSTAAVKISVDREKLGGKTLHSQVRVLLREPAETLVIPVTCELR